jgi:magnesium transporter
LREVLQTLTTRDFPNIQQRTLPSFRDVADHLFRIYETLDSYRDLMSNMLGAHLSQVSNEMNRVMQRLAVVATIFLPITFITGVFGMNFAVQPWLNTDFWFWLFVMTLIAVVIYWWLHRRRWV